MTEQGTEGGGSLKVLSGLTFEEVEKMRSMTESEAMELMNRLKARSNVATANDDRRAPS
jgi:hypothetical protein